MSRGARYMFSSIFYDFQIPQRKPIPQQALNKYSSTLYGHTVSIQQMQSEYSKLTSGIHTQTTNVVKQKCALFTAAELLEYCHVFQGSVK